MDRAEKLAALRAGMVRVGVAGFLIPRGDEFQGEYVPECASRLQWMTGFTGSAGCAAILMDRAYAGSDSRYTIQIRQQVDAALFDIADTEDHPLEAWLAATATAGARIGYDPKLHTPAEIERFTAKGLVLVPVENLVDSVWFERPAAPASAIEIFPESLSGASSASKRDEIVKRMIPDAFIVTASDSIAWLLNVRGRDIPHIPVVLSYLILYRDGRADWFVDPSRADQAVRSHLGNQINLRRPEEFESALRDLAGKSVGLDTERSSIWIKSTLEQAGATVVPAEDPCILPRSRKTPQEQAAIVRSHIRDGVAMVRFLAWLDEEGPKGGLTELDVEAKLLGFRRQDTAFRDTSFDTIAGWAGNGAIVHYRATAATNSRIVPPGLLLLDSGAQYEDGTTDITRTIALGEPTPEMKDRFTRVLKGHIGIARARFPEGTTGAQLDILARGPLWDEGLDYGHGTGHGVGCYLSVHESGTGISRRAMRPILPGQLISNEPGYYKEGAYGIRIETLIMVQSVPGEANKMLGFETVTLAPIDQRLIMVDLLDRDELEWLNAYHERVYKTLSPLLKEDEKGWLKNACAPLYHRFTA